MSDLLTADQWAGLGCLVFLTVIGAGLWLLLDVLTGGDRP